MNVSANSDANSVVTVSPVIRVALRQPIILINVSLQLQRILIYLIYRIHPESVAGAIPLAPDKGTDLTNQGLQ